MHRAAAGVLMFHRMMTNPAMTPKENREGAQSMLTMAARAVGESRQIAADPTRIKLAEPELTIVARSVAVAFPTTLPFGLEDLDVLDHASENFPSRNVERLAPLVPGWLHWLGMAPSAGPPPVPGRDPADMLLSCQMLETMLANADRPTGQR